jgi:DDB1- and CUL4-associated factor 1
MPSRIILVPVLEGETDSDISSSSSSSDEGGDKEIGSSDDENDDDPEFIDEVDLDGGGLQEIMGDGDWDDESDMVGSFTSDDDGWLA